MLADLPILKKGDRGDRVKALQDILNRIGYGLVVDGAYGLETEGAVRSFQNKYGLVTDGIVGNLTLARLQEVAVGPSSSSSSAPLVAKAGMFDGLSVINRPGISGYPLWLEATMVGVTVYTAMMLIGFNRK